MSDLADHLRFLYGESRSRVVLDRLRKTLDRYRPLLDSKRSELSERDAVLITYGDQVQSTGTPPLRVLADFCQKHLTGVVDAVHILPFYPWTSDDGFSVRLSRR